MKRVRWTVINALFFILNGICTCTQATAPKNETSKPNAKTEVTSKSMQPAIKLEKCRCGREQTGIHLLRCLQKDQNKYNTPNSKEEEKNPEEQTTELPRTSNGK